MRIFHGVMKCYKQMSTNLEKIKILLFWKGFFHLRSRKHYKSENMPYKIHLQSSKMTDPLKDQMPLYFQSVENKLHERK